jgi:hypothetical protein
MNPKLSIVVCAYNMPRELPRTIRSLSPAMQRDVRSSDYEIIVVDNGSTKPFDENECRQWGTDLRVLRIAPSSALPSPVRAINAGIEQARGPLVGVMIDGARLASPGLVKYAIMANTLAERTVILTLGFHLGSEVQMRSVAKGYNQEQEDLLLTQTNWTDDGYRLFNISAFAGSSENGWFGTISESNAIFLRKELWHELDGFDEQFQAPGGGLVNLDTLLRAVMLPSVSVITLLGEGTFHQVHDGIATNAAQHPWDAFHTEYKAIRGREFSPPTYQSLYLGSVPPAALASIHSALPANDRRATFHLARAQAYCLLGDATLAESEYRAALTFDEDLVQAHIGLAKLRMPGDDYFVWLQRFHTALVPETYLEIGVARGQSLSYARPPTRVVGVDPEPMINITLKTETHIFCEVSDSFFARRGLVPLVAGRPLGLAFIDGLHTFEQSLKDFINVEAYCGPRSVVLIHDTVPLDEPTQRADRQRKFFTGDVWKTVLCLKHFRPDLDIFTIATPWSGLTVIIGLNPASRVLSENYDDTVARFIDMPYSEIENHLDVMLNLVPNDWRGVAARLEARGLLPASPHVRNTACGD